MYITKLSLKNWRNYREAEAEFGRVSYVIGANASGKSNFLDALRFLRDIAKPEGGGLQQAVKVRGGLSKLRCLHARADSEVRLEIEWSQTPNGPTVWSYILAFNANPKGKDKRPKVIYEKAFEYVGGKRVTRLSRPDESDKSDSELLTQTHLEQKSANKAFRVLADELSGISYLHLVPQLLKHGGEIGGKLSDGDPFGQAFLERIAGTAEATRNKRLDRIKEALVRAVPQFVDLRFKQDKITGRWHLEALYNHHRLNAGWQREDQLSDGTLRMIAIFWLLQENIGVLLLEEPELSLDEDVVRALPPLIESSSASTRQRQVVITTHSSALLDNPGIDGRHVLRVEPAHEGSCIVMPNEEEVRMMEEDGFSPAQALLPKVHPLEVSEMAL